MAAEIYLLIFLRLVINCRKVKEKGNFNTNLVTTSLMIEIKQWYFVLEGNIFIGLEAVKVTMTLRKSLYFTCLPGKKKILRL